LIYVYKVSCVNSLKEKMFKYFNKKPYEIPVSFL
jgi:hypothetical protein